MRDRDDPRVLDPSLPRSCESGPRAVFPLAWRFRYLAGSTGSQPDITVPVSQRASAQSLSDHHWRFASGGLASHPFHGAAWIACRPLRPGQNSIRAVRTRWSSDPPGIRKCTHSARDHPSTRRSSACTDDRRSRRCGEGRRLLFYVSRRSGGFTSVQCRTPALGGRYREGRVRLETADKNRRQVLAIAFDWRDNRVRLRGAAIHRDITR